MTKRNDSVGRKKAGKPHIWWSNVAQVWFCGICRSTDGCGDNPSEAYADWVLALPPADARALGLYT
jgi:hypothetical protein